MLGLLFIIRMYTIKPGNVCPDKHFGSKPTLKN